MAESSNGTPKSHQGSATLKRKPIRPEDVRVVLRNDRKGSEAVFPGPRQTAVLLKERRKQRAQTDPPDGEPEGG